MGELTETADKYINICMKDTTRLAGEYKFYFQRPDQRFWNMNFCETVLCAV